MTKIDGRSRQEAARQLDQSLQRLKTDYIDLVQFHEIIRYDDRECLAWQWLTDPPRQNRNFCT